MVQKDTPLAANKGGKLSQTASTSSREVSRRIAATSSRQPSGQQSTSAAAPTRKITQAERDLLALITNLAAPTFALPNFTLLLQELKGFLYNKDYASAFDSGRKELLDVYAARWVPSRALVYRSIFDQSNIADDLLSAKDEQQTMLILGGGSGSELLALGSVLTDAKAKGKWKERQSIRAHVVDSSDWSSILSSQHSAFASQLPDFHLLFAKADLIKLDDATRTRLDIPSARIVTIFFTISELFLQSRASTVALLHKLTTDSLPGTRLMIVESASLAELPLGKDGRVYPLGIFLDHALEMSAKWAKTTSEESLWYRMPEGAQESYPRVKLENTRVVMRVYKRL